MVCVTADLAVSINGRSIDECTENESVSHHLDASDGQFGAKKGFPRQHSKPPKGSEPRPLARNQDSNREKLAPR